MMAKPIRALELHYPMIQFLLANIIMWQPRVRQNRFNCPIGISSRKTFYFSHIYKKNNNSKLFWSSGWILASFFLFSAVFVLMDRASFKKRTWVNVQPSWSPTWSILHIYWVVWKVFISYQPKIFCTRRAISPAHLFFKKITWLKFDVKDSFTRELRQLSISLASFLSVLKNSFS